MTILDELPAAEPTAADPRVWVFTGSMMIPYELVDPTPLTADELGHLFRFDGGASDPDDPYTCVLCCEAKWKVYGQTCAEGGRLDEANAQRAAWIAEHRYDGVPPGAVPSLGYVAWAGPLA